jgi:hypothetical protein
MLYTILLFPKIVVTFKINGDFKSRIQNQFGFGFPEL